MIEQLADCGYTINEDDPAEDVGEHGILRKYRIEPGPATLTAATNQTGRGSIQFVLTGPQFGMRGGPQETDAVLWMRLVGLGVKFGEAYMVVPSVVDPDFTTGSPGNPETFLPG